MLSTNDGDLSVLADIRDTNQNQHNEMTEERKGTITEQANIPERLEVHLHKKYAQVAKRNAPTIAVTTMIDVMFLPPSVLCSN